MLAVRFLYQSNRKSDTQILDLEIGGIYSVPDREVENIFQQNLLEDSNRVLQIIRATPCLH